MNASQADAAAPLGGRLIAEASTARGWVVVGSPEGLPTERISSLLDGPHGIGAVLPGRSEPRRDTPAADSPLAAVGADLVASASLDPEEHDPSILVQALLSHVRSLGLRVVCEPSWRAPEGFDPARNPGLCRVLVMTDSVASSVLRPDERAVWELLESLSSSARDTEITVVSTERIKRPDDARLLRSMGIRLFDGPIDWDLLGTALANQPSHVIVTSTAATRTSALGWTATRLPGAHRILFLSSLPSEEVSSLAPLNPPDEADSLDHVRVETLGGLEALVAWADAVWYQWPRHSAAAAIGASARPAFRIPPALVHRSAVTADRRGIALVADPGYDVIGGHEDAVVHMLTAVLPEIRRRDPEVPVTVVSDDPSPMLYGASRDAGADIVPATHLEEVLSSTRVFLAGHLYGTGQPRVVLSALEHGAGVVVTPHGSGLVELGTLAPSALRGPDADIISRVWQLLSDDLYFERHRRAANDLIGGTYSTALRTACLDDALASAGIEPMRAEDRWPAEGAPGDLPSRWRAVRVPLRPAGVQMAPVEESAEPVDERERYRIWVDRFGPTPAALAALRSDLEDLDYRPVVSVLMPVHNTSPDLLLEAIDSVRAQIYERWELCIADDASSRPETRQVLEQLRGDPRFRLVRLPTSRGISGATNAALASATGEYVAFLDHDDVLKPHALAQVARWLAADPTIDVLYSDEDKLDPEGRLYDVRPKPDWSPDQLMVNNYVCHLMVVRRSLVEAVGGLRTEFDGSQDHDLALRLSDVTEHFAHIPEPLYSWRAVPGSAAAVIDAKPYAIDACRRAISDTLRRRGWAGKVDETALPNHFRPRYEIAGQPRVAIIIPTRDRAELLERCINSVLDRSTYTNFELLIVDNDSRDPETLEYLVDAPAKVIRYPHRFNYARMMNMAARAVASDVLLFLNNDTEVITPRWIEDLLEHAMRPEVGAVGGRLFYPDGTPQHEGIMVGALGGWAFNVDYGGFWRRGEMISNISAVTGACTMIRTSVYWQVGGNEERLRIAYNDVDLCLRIRQAGYEVLYTPYAGLYHYEGSSRSGYEHPEDGPLFGVRWRPKETGDPYYSPLLSKIKPFSIRI